MSQAYDIAESIAEVYRSQTKPSLTDLAYSQTNNFRVVYRAPYIERESIDDCEAHTFVVLGDRVVTTRDRCGYRFGYNFQIIMFRKLSSVVSDTQPGDLNELDATLTYMEWIQDQVNLPGILRAGGQQLTQVEIVGWPSEELVVGGVWAAAMEFRYDS
jgi:hypothetical protein